MRLHNTAYVGDLDTLRNLLQEDSFKRWEGVMIIVKLNLRSKQLLLVLYQDKCKANDKSQAKCRMLGTPSRAPLRTTAVQNMSIHISTIKQSCTTKHVLLSMRASWFIVDGQRGIGLLSLQVMKLLMLTVSGPGRTIVEWSALT